MKRINLSISKKGSIERAIQELEAYKQKLNRKTEEFVNRLMDIGISVAENHTGQYAGMIVFKKELKQSIDGYDGLIIAADKHKIIKEWYTSKKNGENQKNARSYEISATLLSEFGSGWLANVLYDVPGVGQGTMPNSYGHATDPDGWYWYDNKGVKHHSIGEAPTYPMHSASMAILSEIDTVAREVFGNG